LKQQGASRALFNKNQFNATSDLLNQIERATTDTIILNRIKPLGKLAKAYALWDVFQHHKAFQIIKRLERDELNRNKRFLGQLFRATEPEPYYIADLLNNAKRRGSDEKKFDDAVARLYRTIELIAQYTLKREYNIDVSNVSPDQIPTQLLQKWNMPPEKPRILLALEKDYEILAAMNHLLGQRFAQDMELKDLLNKRNTSILAHNLIPVDQKTYRKIFQKAIEYATSTIRNLNQLIDDSTFIKWTD